MKQRNDKIKGHAENGAVRISGTNGKKVYAVGATCQYFCDQKPVDFFLVKPIRQAELVIVCLNSQSFRLVYIATESNKKNLITVYTIPVNIPFIIAPDGDGFYFFDSTTGYFRVYIKDAIYTNDPKLKSCEDKKAFFVVDVSILLNYALGYVNEEKVFTAAKETAQEISEAEKTAAQIKALKNQLEIVTAQTEKLQSKLVLTEKCIRNVHTSFKFSNRTWIIMEIPQKGNISSEMKTLLEEILTVHFDLFRKHKFVTEMATNAVEIFKTPDNNGWKNLTVETGNPVTRLLFQTKEWKESAIAMYKAQKKFLPWKRRTAIQQALSNFPYAKKPENLASGHRNMKRK